MRAEVREEISIQQEIQDLYDLVRFVYESTKYDKVGRSALLFTIQRDYHPMVIQGVRNMILCQGGS